MKPLAETVSSSAVWFSCFKIHYTILNQSAYSEAVDALKYSKDLIHKSIYLCPCLLLCFLQPEWRLSMCFQDTTAKSLVPSPTAHLHSVVSLWQFQLLEQTPDIRSDQSKPRSSGKNRCHKLHALYSVWDHKPTLRCLVSIVDLESLVIWFSLEIFHLLTSQQSRLEAGSQGFYNGS